MAVRRGELVSQEAASTVDSLPEDHLAADLPAKAQARRDRRVANAVEAGFARSRLYGDGPPDLPADEALLEPCGPSPLPSRCGVLVRRTTRWETLKGRGWVLKGTQSLKTA